MGIRTRVAARRTCWHRGRAVRWTSRGTGSGSAPRSDGPSGARDRAHRPAGLVLRHLGGTRGADREVARHRWRAMHRRQRREVHAQPVRTTGGRDRRDVGARRTRRSHARLPVGRRSEELRADPVPSRRAGDALLVEQRVGLFCLQLVGSASDLRVRSGALPLDRGRSEQLVPRGAARRCRNQRRSGARSRHQRRGLVHGVGRRTRGTTRRTNARRHHEHEARRHRRPDESGPAALCVRDARRRQRSEAGVRREQWLRALRTRRRQRHVLVLRVELRRLRQHLQGRVVRPGDAGVRDR